MEIDVQMADRISKIESFTHKISEKIQGNKALISITGNPFSKSNEALRLLFQSDDTPMYSVASLFKPVQVILSLYFWLVQSSHRMYYPATDF